MSHVVAIGPVFQEEDLPELKRLVEEQGAQWKEGQKSYRWYGRWMNDYSGEDAAYNQGVAAETYGRCEHAISIPGATYEVGIVRTDKGLKLSFDNWSSGGLSPTSVAGQKALALAQGMSVHLVKKQAKRLGFSMSAAKTRTDGKVEIGLTPRSNPGSGLGTF